MTAMAATQEELELQDHVTRVLESQGVLGKIKAQLRAAVYQSIHSAGTTRESDRLGFRGFQPSVVPTTAILQSFGADAPVALELVRNLLECLELDHTLAVFLAEAGLDGGDLGANESEWRVPARLCERVHVPIAEETTPVLIKMLRRDQHGEKHMREVEPHDAEPTPTPKSTAIRKGEFVGVEDDATQSEAFLKPLAVATHVELSFPPIKTAPAPAIQQATPTLTAQQRFDDDDDGDMEASMAEEVVSGSFEEESLAESASVDQSQSHDLQRHPSTSPSTARPGRFGVQDEDNEEDKCPSIASPPPVPTKLGPLPSLPGMGAMSHYTKPSQEESDEDEQAERFRVPEPGENEDDDDDDLDDEAAAARLRSLEEKLKEMEADDDTGVLQQLKATARDAGDEPAPTATPSKATSGKGEEDDDNYGSDFEEEIEEAEEDDIASEMSEDIASMSMLSESGEPTAPPTSKLDSTPNPLANDTPVDSEDALNCYDYIEAVDRH